VAVRQAALVSDESALEACLRRCAIQIDDLYLFFIWQTGLQRSELVYWLVVLLPLPAARLRDNQHLFICLFISLFVSRIVQKLQMDFGWNLWTDSACDALVQVEIVVVWFYCSVPSTCWELSGVGWWTYVMAWIFWLAQYAQFAQQ